MSKNLKCNRVTFYLSAFVKIVQKDVNKDQKRHKVDTIDSTSHNKSYDTIKLISRVQNITLKFEYKNRCHTEKIS